VNIVHFIKARNSLILSCSFNDSPYIRCLEIEEERRGGGGGEKMEIRKKISLY